MASVYDLIESLLEKMISHDQDLRYIATKDLLDELQKEHIVFDDDFGRKVVHMLFKRQEDQSSEIQHLAVECLGHLVNKVNKYQVELIVERLCLNMVCFKKQLYDISCSGLKTVIAVLPQAPGGFSDNICERIIGRLTIAIERQDDVSVKLEALDMITDLLSTFGAASQNFHGSILETLLPQLCSQHQAVRKRAISACSNLVLSCMDSLYAELVDHLYDGLCSDKDNSQIRTYVQCIAAVCRQSGHKFGEYIPKFVPLILQCSEVDDDELRELCLQAFECFINRCPKEITENNPAITDLCLKYIVYDPNYNYDEDEGAGGQSEGDDDEEDEENDEYSDDDDMSWKVRRSAAKCLEAVISTRHELLPEFYKVLSPCLIARFKEREEDVKSDIFHAYIALLKQTTSTVNVNMDPNAMVMDKEEENRITLLESQIDFLIKGVQGQMREKSMKTRQDCFHLLKEVCSVLPGALSTHIGDLIPGILYSLTEKNGSNNMKIDALSFVYYLLTSHQPRVFHPHISTLLPPVITAVGDSFHKVTAEALSVLQELIKVIRPLNAESDFDFGPFTKDIYSCTFLRLKTADTYQEVKEKAISTMGQVICNLGDHLKDELPFCLPLFLDRLKNEITRLTTVEALTKIAGSPLGIELPILPDTMPVLGLFLRKNQRALKLSTLQLIDCLINNYNKDLNVQLLQPIIAEVPPLLDESDLHIAQWTLIILRSVAKYHPKALQDINNTIMPRILLFVKSPFPQGTTLQSMLDFFKSLVKCNLQGVNYDLLFRLLQVPVSNLITDLTTIANLKQVILNSLSAVSEEVKFAVSYALGSCIGNLQQYLPFIMEESQDQPKRQYLLLDPLKEMVCSSDRDSFIPIYMQDLMIELRKDSIELDDFLEEQVVRVLLKLLKDKSDKVQNLVVKCLGVLVNKFEVDQVELLVETLCSNIYVSRKEQLRDISAFGLKTVIAELPEAPGDFSGYICEIISSRLTPDINQQDNLSIQFEALDIMIDLLLRFGPALQNFHGSILAALLPQLSSRHQTVRKQTISACSNLMLSCDNSLHAKLVEHLYDGLYSDRNNCQIGTYVQCVTAICRQSGHNFGEYIPKFVPLILQCSEVDHDEVREFCLQAFESFIHRYPEEITEHIPVITDLCRKYMVYDPNYNYDKDEGADDKKEENDGNSDYDDMSWKVRRAATKCLEAVISTRPEPLPEFYTVLSPFLIARFKEREENVKSDIFHAYIALLKQTKSTVNVNMDLNAIVMDEEGKHPIAQQLSQVDLLVKGVQGQMRQKSMKTRQDCFHLLQVMCYVLPGALSTHIGDLIPGILYSLSEKNASSMDALSFIYYLLTRYPLQELHPHISTLLPPLLTAVEGCSDEISAEALSVLEELIKVIRPLNVESDFDFSPFTEDIYFSTLLCLKPGDINQEKAISTMGQVICNLGDHLKSELPFCLPLFLDCLKNRITRLTTVKALTKIAGSPLRIELPILPDTMPVLGRFLRKKQRALKLGTLQLIECLMYHYNRCLNEQLLQPIIDEVPPLLSESDLRIVELTLIILRSVAIFHPRVLSGRDNPVIPYMLLLVKSPSLQDVLRVKPPTFSAYALIDCVLEEVQQTMRDGNNNS